MPHINKKEEQMLIDIEEFMFHILNYNRDVFKDVEGFLLTYERYVQLWELNERLIKEREKTNRINKERMWEYRHNPKTREKAKKQAREYMRKYNRRKKEVI